ncbi:MAG: hypothetical protein JSS14_22730 [Proteobacteria bacterium]|nr:hypothetical protein [Pseudomonadota bacterium]
MACVTSFDDGLKATAKAWTSGALLAKVNPRRVERVLEALATRETTTISALVVEIAAPDNSVSAVAAQTAVNNPMREQFVRGVMGAVMAAILDVQKAYSSEPITAAALLDRLRDWIANPEGRQGPGLDTADRDKLEAANEILGKISADILAGADPRSAAMVRVGIVGPLGVALQIMKLLQETPPEALGLQVAGFELAVRGAATTSAADAASTS